MLTATIRYPFDPRIEQLFSAESKTFPRTTYTITTQPDAVLFQITAEDATALRAALTTITKVLSVWETTKDYER